jgi:hypothetical protein
LKKIEKLDGKVIYSLACSAYFVDKKWGYGVPKAGIKLMGDIGHRHKIPVTYLITSQVAESCKRLLTTFHVEYGDEVALMLDFPDELNSEGKMVSDSKDIIDKMSVAELREYILKETQLIKKELPWAKILVIGGGHRTENVVEAALLEGMIGVWGYCVFQIGTDNITDYGCPWGQFFISKENYKAPSPVPREIVGLEWTCRDISKAFHMAKSESYSTDPNDVESNAKCTDENIDYWKDLLKEYQRNLKFNDNVYFLQHQEAHEMEWSEVCHGFNKWRIEFTANMLDKFCKYVSQQKDVVSLTLNDACQLYIQKYQGKTPPTYFYQNDIKIRTPSWQQQVLDNKATDSKHLWIGFNELMYDYVDKYTKKPQFHNIEPPWRDSLFYFDSDSMLVFDRGIREPIWITDYKSKAGSLDENFMWTPSPKIMESNTSISDEQLQNGILQKTITYKIKSDKEVGYGIFEWINLELEEYKIVECSVPQYQVFEYAGVFLKIPLKIGITEVKIVLQGKICDEDD